MTQTAPGAARVVLASSNAGKLREFASLLAPFNWSLINQDSLGITAAEEPFHTFVENALAKARHASAAAQLPAIADDSGLCVTALGGAPGVRSARYANVAREANPGSILEPQTDHAANIAALLNNLQGESDRSAWFHCTLVYLRSADDPAPIIASGTWHGEILETPQGDGGFGYDPIFFHRASGLSAAELPAADKARLSHRGAATRAFAAALKRHHDGG